MNLAEKINEAQCAVTSVDVSFPGTKLKHKVRLKRPSAEGVLEWAEKTGANGHLVKDGKKDFVTSDIEAAVIVLRHTLVVDEDQPEMTEEQIKALFARSGGYSKKDGALIKAAGDLMWAEAGYPDDAVQELVDKLAQAKEVPLESSEPTPSSP